MGEDKCPKCGKKMTSTTPEKSYCMKCDILVHTPTNTAYTGDPKEDKFIGSPAVWLGEEKKDIEATATLDSLVMTWKEGKTFSQKRLPYTVMTGVELRKRKESNVTSLAAAVIGGGLIGLAASALSSIQTLIVKTKEGDYELFISQPSDWADRLRSQMVATALGQPVEPDRSSI
jgi:hypothetical protein